MLLQVLYSVGVIRYLSSNFGFVFQLMEALKQYVLISLAGYGREEDGSDHFFELKKIC